MATVSISEAARLAGVSRKTIQRHIANGKLSATMSQDTDPPTRQVEISELMRVYGNLVSPKAEESAAQVLNLSYSDDALRQVIDMQKEAIGILKTQVDELKIEKKELRAQLAGFLEYTKPTPVQIPMNYRITIGILAIVVIAMAIAVYLRLQ
jgi:hypothetical protein